MLRPKDADVREPKLLVRARDGYARRDPWLFGRRLVVLAGVAALLLVTGVVASRLGSEFLPELDEGDIVIFVEMPPSISLDRGGEVLTEVRRRLLAFPEVLETLSEQGRPEDGTDDEGVNMSETFVHVAPTGQVAAGHEQGSPVRSDARSRSPKSPASRFNFSGPIKDNVEEAVSGVRGQVVLKIFGTDLDVMKHTLEDAIAAIGKVPGVVDLELYRDATVPQLQIALDRGALARSGISVDAAEDVVQTALAGSVATTYWENERPVPVRLMFPAAERDDEARIGGILVPSSSGGHVPLGEVAHIERAVGQGGHHAGIQQPRARAQVQRRRTRPRVGGDRRDCGREARREGAGRQLLRVGRRVREPEARAGATGGDRAALVSRRVRPAVHGARLRAAARSRCSSSRRSR